MFNTMIVAKRIREARISQNMTQMNLADAMEVSYQAVSNWERGNSMPDISKLEQLCQILHLSMDELLGSESSKTLHHILEKETENPDKTEPVPLPEIQNVAPLLPPADVEKLVDEHLEQKGPKHLNPAAIADLAPFLGAQYLDHLIREIQVDDLTQFTGIAPFLSTETLNRLTLNCDPKTNKAGIAALAPFLSADTLDRLAVKLTDMDGLTGITALAPFLSKETLDTLVLQADPENDMVGIVSLAPFLKKSTLDQLVQKIVPLGGLTKLSGLAPFLSKETLDAVALNADLTTEMPGITSLAPFLAQKTLNSLLEKALENDNVRISGLYPFLPRESLEQLARHRMGK